MSLRTVFARISSLTWRDVQPLLRSSPSVAGRVMRASVCLLDSAAPRSARSLRHNVPGRGPDGTLERASRRRTSWPKQFADTAFDDHAWTDRPSPRITGAPVDEFAATDGPVLYRRRLTAPAPARDRRRRSSSSTASSTTATSGSTATTSGRPRATSSRTRSRSPMRCAPRANTCSRSRSRARRNATAPRSARSPACSGTGTRLDPDVQSRRPVASDPHRRDRTRSASRRCACCAPKRSRNAAGSTCDVTLDADDGSARRRPARGGVRPQRRDAARRVPTGHARGGREPAVVGAQRRRRAALVAAGARRPAAVHGARRGRGRRRHERRTHAAHRVPRDPQRRLEVLRQRRADVPQGHEPRADAHGARRRVGRRTSRATSSSREDANLDLVRVHAHVARPELYDAADELGLLVWQDLPLQWGYARGVRTSGGASGARDGRPARPPPERRAVVRAQRAVRRRP